MEDISSGAPPFELVAAELPPELESLLLSQELDDDEVVVLPQRVQAGRGEYAVEAVQTVKVLRAQGLQARLLHSSGNRTSVAEFSTDEVVALTLFVAQSLGQEGISRLVDYLVATVRGAGRRAAPATIEIEIDRLVIEGDRRTIEGVVVKGRGEEAIDGVVSVLKRLGTSD
ncbi:hypothetical protein [Phycicoccus jejuensis]|uniref:hypothetical protein n=1 Tax=Phycicoccus jejuensis TaxID=367299 RepID=UPI0012F85499|nr:hypothetical protein [Phycicoccus jejuensis]